MLTNGVFWWEGVQGYWPPTILVFCVLVIFMIKYGSLLSLEGSSTPGPPPRKYATDVDCSYNDVQVKTTNPVQIHKVVTNFKTKIKNIKNGMKMFIDIRYIFKNKK